MKDQLKFFMLWLLLGAAACQSDETASSGEKTASPQAEEHPEAFPDLVSLSADQQRIGAIVVGKIEYRNLGQVLQVNGRLAVPAQSQLNVTALQGGFVRSLPLIVGQPVRKGQALARLENPDLIQIQQDYAENSSRLTYLETELARQQELTRENVGALKVLQQTSAELKAIRARVTGLAQRIRLVGLSPEAVLRGQFSTTYVVKSPVSGVVTDVLVSTGGYVQPTDVMAHVTSNQGLYAELTVFEKDLAQLRPGQRVSIRLNNEAGNERIGRITYINRTIDADRSVRVIARLDQPDGRLTPNTFLKASLDVGNSRVTALPEEAIVSAEGKDYIFVMTDEKIPDEHDGPAIRQQADEKNPAGKEGLAQETGEVEPNSTTFRRIPVRRGVTEGGYSQVILPTGLDITKAQVVTKGAFSVLSQLKAASGEEEEHGH